MSACPFCKEEGSSFSVAHLSKCADVFNIIINSCDDITVDLVLTLCTSLPDKRYWMLHLLNCTEHKTKSAILEIFAIFSIVIGNGLHDFSATPAERVAAIRTKKV